MKHDANQIRLLLFQYDLARLGLLEEVQSDLCNEIATRNGLATHLQVTVKSSLEPLASGAQDEFVDTPVSVAANDGSVGKISRLEKTNGGGDHAAVAVGVRHLEVLKWQL